MASIENQKFSHTNAQGGGARRCEQDETNNLKYIVIMSPACALFKKLLLK